MKTVELIRKSGLPVGLLASLMWACTAVSQAQTGSQSGAQTGTQTDGAQPSQPQSSGTSSDAQKPASPASDTSAASTTAPDKTSKPDDATLSTNGSADDSKNSGKGKKKDSKDVATAPAPVLVEPGSQMEKVKPGSIEDVSAVGNRDIGGRGVGNWYSTDSEIKMGRQYAAEIEKSTKFITDPVVTEYVNRIGQNIVKNSDCKVPFTIKVIDSDEINAMALPGGFFYVNSGLILNADEEAELAGVMAHEIAHVCAHHAAREMTRANYAQLGTIPLIFIGGWTGYGIYEAASIADSDHISALFARVRGPGRLSGCPIHVPRRLRSAGIHQLL